MLSISTLYQAYNFEVQQGNGSSPAKYETLSPSMLATEMLQNIKKHTFTINQVKPLMEVWPVNWNFIDIQESHSLDCQLYELRNDTNNEYFTCRQMLVISSVLKDIDPQMTIELPVLQSSIVNVQAKAGGLCHQLK